MHYNISFNMLMVSVIIVNNTLDQVVSFELDYEIEASVTMLFRCSQTDVGMYKNCCFRNIVDQNFLALTFAKVTSAM